MTPEEISLVCKGNQEAMNFVGSWVTFCHVVDDVVDEDKPVTDEMLIKAMASYTVTLAKNPFFKAHSDALVSLMLQGFSAWLDSNQMEESEDLRTRQTSDVVKGFYHEVVWHVALLCGGYDHWREITKAHRKYDYDH